MAASDLQHDHSDIHPGPNALPRLGRRMTDRTAEMTFPIARDRALVYLITGMIGIVIALLSWLCVKTMTLSEQMGKMDERSSSYKEQLQLIRLEQERMALANARQDLELKHLQIQAATHGWKMGD